jgi:hypothetical protein
MSPRLNRRQIKIRISEDHYQALATLAKAAASSPSMEATKIVVDVLEDDAKAHTNSVPREDIASPP